MRKPESKRSKLPAGPVRLRLDLPGEKWNNVNILIQSAQ